MADVHPVITVLGIILGLEYLGVTGLIFGPLLISYFVILFFCTHSIHTVVNLEKFLRSKNIATIRISFQKLI
jgi:predicted PurR-regulated permease PerM